MTSGLASVRVAHVPADAPGVPPTTPAGLRELTNPRVLEAAVDALTAEPVDAIGYASTSTAYVIGFDAEVALLAGIARRAGVPAVGTCASAVRALLQLGAERVALIHPPWFDKEMNELGMAYFESQGLEVVMSASAELSQDPRQIEPAAVLEWVSRHVSDDADAIFIGGNGFRAAAAIGALEQATGRPVLESNQVLLWGILAETGIRLAPRAYGRLFGGGGDPKLTQIYEVN